MFERFTERARGVLADATGLATELKSPAIRRHHLLVALIDAADDGSGSVAAVLDDAGVDRAVLRADLVASLTASETTLAEPPPRLPFTAETKKALELSLREALSLGHNYIGREHLLLGVLRDPEGPLADVLANAKLDHGRAREIVAEISPPSERRGRRSERLRRARVRGSNTFESVLRRALARSERRSPTTGDLLVALLETSGTHFAAALAGSSLPSAEAAGLIVDKLIADKVPDGTADAIQVQEGAVTINDPRIAEAVKKLVGDNVTPERINEILRRLES